MVNKKEYSWTEGLKEAEKIIDQHYEDHGFSSEKFLDDLYKEHEEQIDKNDKEGEFNETHKRTMKIVDDFVPSVSMWLGAVDAVDYATMMYLFVLFRYKEIEWEKLEMVLDDPKLGRAMLLQSLVAYVEPPVEEKYD